MSGRFSRSAAVFGTVAVVAATLQGSAQADGPDESAPAAPGAGERAGHPPQFPPGRPAPPKQPVATGFGGAVATVDADATAAGMRALRRGGTATDAAVAAAAALGVTEPFSSGIGGGGFYVHYDAGTGEVSTLDGRETAPAAATEELFIDAETGEPLPFQQARVSGLSVGTPGTLQTWQEALDRWGRRSLADALSPATRLAARGFVVDETFRSQVAGNAELFADFPASAELFLPDGAPPEVGSRLRNRDLAATYRLIARHGTDAFYGGEIGADVAATVQDPPVADDADRDVRPGSMTVDDLAGYEVVEREPTTVEYDGLQVFGMGPPSSGGSTVGEALNILETADPGPDDTTAALHHYLEASALAFADRNRYVGDPDVVDVPLDELLSQGFADERACEIAPAAAADKPVAPGVPDGEYTGGDSCGPEAGAGAVAHEGMSTTHLTTADRWGNVVAYTLTIEQTGGSGIAVPGRGFLLNNELTDFNFAPSQGDAPDPNLPGPGKRPRSSISPTIVLDDGEPFLALGTPGGSTIITTVLQTLVNRIDLGMDLPEALAAPRASQRNTPSVTAEPEFVESRSGEQLRSLGHSFTTTPEIGALTGLEFLRGGRIQAVAEPERRGGGSAAVLFPVR
ncbi:gamma-glutamyltranspeptidase/glutathione hydrolase [Haloactinopolyspora alba]|uniref:Glutathione hydrolase proenzyme n=1 Tax=Haloactinopolyspora alba TaxID=648780 RepID=A0A2P8DV93_9ACTN|nr:gamma-glutamyltransferase [Haloactinopolyspora alba]PSL01114.1 gamma-glutamyltranspeptidase/glutathione hydrolase [Haloactinopolyspora alba]